MYKANYFYFDSDQRFLFAKYDLHKQSKTALNSHGKTSVILNIIILNIISGR